MARILAFAGSARKDSINKKLVKLGASKAEALGAHVTLIDLNDYPMPLYHGDLEDSEGVPVNARKLRTLMLEHDGFLIACPEYNSSITPLLKNTIDWCSRPDGETPGGIAYRGKVAALIATSDGNLGGLRGLDHVREILANIGVHVVPMQAAVGNYSKAFDPGRGFTDERTGKFFESVIGLLVKTCDNLKG
jgi:NAD(P)H-dependent FMN reductase